MHERSMSPMEKMAELQGELQMKRVAGIITEKQYRDALIDSAKAMEQHARMGRELSDLEAINAPRGDMLTGGGATPAAGRTSGRTGGRTAGRRTPTDRPRSSLRPPSAAGCFPPPPRMRST